MAVHWSLEWQRGIVEWDLDHVIIAKYLHVGSKRNEEWIYFRQDADRRERQIGFLRRTKGQLGLYLWSIFLV